jgi:hypothetical protein
MSVRVAIALVHKEQSERQYCNRVGPQVPAKQSPHQADLDCSMPQQEKCGEDFGAASEVLYGVQENIGKNVMRILAEFVLREYPQHSIDLTGVHKKQDDATEDFEHAVYGLANQTNVKEDVNRLTLIVLSHFDQIKSEPCPTVILRVGMPV